MEDMDNIVAFNINEALRNRNRKQTELASFLKMSPQVVSKMLSGVRTITAFELNKISEFLGMKMESFFELNSTSDQSYAKRLFMGRITTEEGKKALDYTDTIIDIYLQNAQFQKKEFVNQLLDYE